MKRIIYIFSVLLAAITFSSCNAILDGEVPDHLLDAENAVTNESSAMTALNGVYSYLGDAQIFDCYYISNSMMRTGLMSREKTGRGDLDIKLIEFTLDLEDTQAVEPFWEATYKILNAANNLIAAIEKLDESKFGPNRKLELLGEARCLRAFANDLALRHYGHYWDINSEYGAIIKLLPSSLTNHMQARSTVKESYQAIIDDLDYAIANAPSFSSNVSVSKEYAMALKADVLLNRGDASDYPTIITLADDVINSGVFELEDEFSDVFANGYSSKELMFTRILKTIPTEDSGHSLWSQYGDGSYNAGSHYNEILTKSDARWVHTMDSITSVHETTGYVSKKEVFKKHRSTTKDAPMYYMRLAQVYLMKAEAMAENGASEKSIIEVLNVLRDRSNNTTYAENQFGGDIEQIKKEIFYEYVREVGCENTSIYDVMLRIKIGNVRLLDEYNPYYGGDDDKLSLPIPPAELEHNSEMTQNPHYTN